MNEPRTLLIEDEEAPTVVDLGSGRAVRARATPHAIDGSSREQLGRVRIVCGTALVLLFWMVLLDLALRERRNSADLRRILDELGRDRDRVADTTHPWSTEEALRLRSETPEEEPVTERSVVGAPHELETKAASALLANDHRRALRLYRVLAREAPREQAFSHVVTILEARLRCPSRQEAMGRSCP